MKKKKESLFLKWQVFEQRHRHKNQQGWTTSLYTAHDIYMYICILCIDVFFPLTSNLIRFALRQITRSTHTKCRYLFCEKPVPQRDPCSFARPEWQPLWRGKRKKKERKRPYTPLQFHWKSQPQKQQGSIALKTSITCSQTVLGRVYYKCVSTFLFLSFLLFFLTR